jgi:osmotically-inducible protein OsmY
MTVLAAGWVSRAQEPTQTTTEKIKAKVGAAAESIKKGAISAETAIKEQFAKAKDAVVRMGIEGRVYARLHWDKALTGAKIELGSPKPGVIALSGAVADSKAKAKAIELTTDTVGVTEVVDHLTVQTTASIAEPPKR